MPARLVYSPKIYAFTKNAQEETLNISPWVVSGDTVRNLDGASTASLVLRNPDKIFTTPKNGIAFHPQDPITIYLERLAGYPVRVFTGYLDETPYLQLQPSVIQLQATCTIKRLQFTYFDPSLPYMISFFEKYGWFNTGQGSIISSSSVGANNLAQNKMKLENSSIARLLWGVLYDIGEWNDTDIWIEPVPTGANGIVNRVLTLMKQFDQQNTQAADELQQIFNTMLGKSGIGSGAGSVGLFPGGANISIKAISKLSRFSPTEQTFIASFYKTLPLNPVVIAAWVAQEGGSSFGGAYNYLNIGNVSSGVALAGNDNIWNDPATAGSVTAQWLTGRNVVPGYGPPSAGIQRIASTIGQSPESQIRAIQTSGWAKSGEPLLPALYNEFVAAIGPNPDFSITSPSSSKTNKNSPSVKNTKPTQKIVYNAASLFSNNPLANLLPGLQGVSASSSSSSSITGVHTVYEAIVAAANALASSKLPYPNPDAHYGSLAQPWPAYDCSGSVSFVLYAAGLLNSDKGNATSGFDTPHEQGILEKAGFVQGTSTHPMSVTIWVNPKPGENGHTFMCIGGTQGRYWGTATIPGPYSDSVSQSGAGAWLQAGNTISFTDIESQGFTPYYLPHSKLISPTIYQAPGTPGNTSIPSIGVQSNGSGSVGAAPNTGTSGNTISQSSAEAFTQQLAFPSIEDSIVAILLGGEGKGLMHDQELLPFVQQVTQSSLRHFTSLPDGSFYAFYPDYFGEMGQHDPYWYIDDIEIISGTINVTDQGLATHVFAVGDSTWPINNQLMNELFSAGTITVFNAFDTKGKTIEGNNRGPIMDTKEALAFIKRYGARPVVQDYPMVRSGVFEMLMAYQLFQLMWALQFSSNFTFTFMPELFPGGKVGFPSHGLMMYIDQVTHIFDYEAGFTTTARLMAPSVMAGYNGEEVGLPPNMSMALVEPINHTDITPKVHKNVNSTTKKQPPRIGSGFRVASNS